MWINNTKKKWGPTTREWRGLWGEVFAHSLSIAVALWVGGKSGALLGSGGDRGAWCLFIRAGATLSEWLAGLGTMVLWLPSRGHRPVRVLGPCGWKKPLLVGGGH